MPGWSNADNLFGVSDYIVGSSIGDGCNYTSINAAVADIVAAGGIGTIWIRPGTYTENITINSVGALVHIDICASAADGRVPAPVGTVNINGNHTIGGDNFTIVIFENISFAAAAGDNFLLNPTAGQVILACQECSVVSAAARCVFINPSVGASAQFSTQDAQMSAAFQVIDIGANGGGSSNIRGQFSSSGNNVARIAGPGGVQFDGAAIFGTTNAFALLDAGAGVDVRNGTVTSTDACFTFAVAGGSVTAIDMVISSADASGNFITGTGTLNYASIYPSGSINIDAAVTQNIFDWKPYARSGAPPGVGVSRGTAAFSTDDFTLTDGFVELLNGPTGLTWTDQGAPTTVTSFSGSFVTASITLTLPAAPVQGDVVAFKVDGAFVLVVQANGAQVIKIGNTSSAAGGTATGTDDGDALHLTYRAASNTWLANSVIGNWVLA